MKIRSGFVSNSSSASFVILKRNISFEQLKIIRNPEMFKDDPRLSGPEGIEVEDYEYLDGWKIQENPDVIWGETCMDNFDYADLFDRIGVNWDCVGWGD